MPTPGLMRIQLDLGVPVVFGALTAVRGPSSALAGIGKGSGKDHNDGED